MSKVARFCLSLEREKNTRFTFVTPSRSYLEGVYVKTLKKGAFGDKYFRNRLEKIKKEYVPL